MSNKNVILISAVAAAMLVGALGCSSGGGGHRDPVTPQGGDGIVVVSAGAGNFYGFDIVIDYAEAVVTPHQPIADAIMGTDMTAGCTCEEQQIGTTLRLSCIKATPVAGPGALVNFAFDYDGRQPQAGDFVVTCDFRDQDGRETEQSCTTALNF